MGRSLIKKINKVTEVLNDTIDQIDLINFYWTPQPPPSKKKKENNQNTHSFQVLMGCSLG